jgi:nitrogen fixation protein FixH
MTERNKPSVARKRSIWPYALGVMFCVHASIVFITMTFASRTPANAEPEYYEKAVAWDDQAGERLTAQREGWSCTVTNDGRSVRIALVDRESAPITASAVTAVAFHRADALDRSTLVFIEAEPGVYTAQLPSDRMGLWDVRFSIVTEQGARASLVETIEIFR